MKFNFSQVQAAQRDFDWRGYSADTSEADVLRLAAKALEVPEKDIETLRTEGGWLARERRKEQDGRT